ncbi:MAG TPA: hypothetical protein VL024_06100 [Castellaniella sp.]|nr:hypothetical protein [Castellaniella sp.]
MSHVHADHSFAIRSLPAVACVRAASHQGVHLLSFLSALLLLLIGCRA